MNPLIALVHALGTKPLTVSLVAQLIVIGLAIRSKNKGQLGQSLVLMAGLLMAVTSIALRPPSPVRLLPDLLGTGAALLFVAPAVQAWAKFRKSQQGGKPG